MKISLKTKTVLMLLTTALVLIAVSAYVSYSIYTDNVFAYYKENAEKLAKTEAVSISNDKIADLTKDAMSVYREICAENGGNIDFSNFSDKDWQNYYNRYSPVVQSQNYADVINEIQTLADINDVASMYICYMDEITDKAVYIIDGSTNEDACMMGDCDDIESGNLELMQNGVYDFPAYITNYEEYGWLCSASAAITDNSGKVIANAYVDISMDKVVTDRLSFLKNLSIALVIAAFLMVIVMILLVNRMIVSPINLLSAAAATFISDKEKHTGEDESAIKKLSIKTGDEIEKLANSVKQMEEEIDDYIENLTAVTAERERIGAELSVATSIQASMLPCIFPAFPEHKEFDIYATMDPAKEVGGDFYDFFLIDENHLAVVIADVSGKGVGAALFMVIAKTLIKNYAQSGIEPSQVFTEVNAQLCENNKEGLFVTAWMGVLEISNGKFTFVNAGHNPPLLRKSGGSFEFLKSRPGFVLAGMEGIKYKQNETVMEKGDCLYLYTDGVTEATNAKNELYGDNRLQEILNNSSNMEVRELLSTVRRDIDEFVKEAPQFDDITMLGLKIKGRDENV